MLIMKYTYKFFIVLSVIVLIAAGCTKTQPAKDTGRDDTNLEQTDVDPISPEPEKVNQSPEVKTPTADALPKTVVPAANEIKYQGEEGKNALTLLKAKYKVETKSFGSAGEFVESINGIKPDSKHFWKFFINGKSASVGASSYVTKSTDVLEWKLDVIQ